MEVFSEALWVSIDDCKNGQYLLEIINNEETPLEFIVKILVRIGFSCEDAVRLMMKLHKNGTVVLASADKETLFQLQEYIKTQSSTHDCCLLSRIIKI
jgi:ATP-dependent Clp protease adapter protein ClpS